MLDAKSSYPPPHRPIDCQSPPFLGEDAAIGTLDLVLINLSDRAKAVLPTEGGGNNN